MKYVVVRYVPDIAKDEPINVGVILQDPEGHLIGKFPNRIEGLERLPRGTDRRFVRQMVEAIQDQVGHYLRGFPGGTSSERLLEEWGTSLSNQIQFTAPRVTVPDDPVIELQRLYSRLVSEGRELSAMPVEDKRVHSSVRRMLAGAFKTKKADFRRFVRERVAVPGNDWPTIEVGFAFRNGRQTIANALSLDVKERRAEEKIKVWEANYADILETTRFDTQHIITILHAPPESSSELGELADKVLGKVSTIIHDTQQGLQGFAFHVLEMAEEWPDEETR